MNYSFYGFPYKHNKKTILWQNKKPIKTWNDGLGIYEGNVMKIKYLPLKKKKKKNYCKIWSNRQKEQNKQELSKAKN